MKRPCKEKEGKNGREKENSISRSRVLSDKQINVRCGSLTCIVFYIYSRSEDEQGFKMEKDEAVIKLLNIIYKNSQVSPRELAKTIGKLNKISKQIKNLIKYRTDNDNP